jgi:Raf kinase inhibitor-like YbhB/YbcL family protein
MAIMRLWSDGFGEGEEIPVRYTKDGDNISPPFGWSGLPGGTRELVLILEGVTPATHEPWVHWLVYQIAPDLEGLPKGFKHKREPQEPVHLMQGTNSLGNIGYDGPQGTVGRIFRYRIRLLALDTLLDLEPGLDRQQLEKAMAGHVLGEAELHGRYERRD